MKKTVKSRKKVFTTASETRSSRALATNGIHTIASQALVADVEPPRMAMAEATGVNPEKTISTQESMRALKEPLRSLKEPPKRKRKRLKDRKKLSKKKKLLSRMKLSRKKKSREEPLKISWQKRKLFLIRKKLVSQRSLRKPTSKRKKVIRIRLQPSTTPSETQKSTTQLPDSQPRTNYSVSRQKKMISLLKKEEEPEAAEVAVVTEGAEVAEVEEVAEVAKLVEQEVKERISRPLLMKNSPLYERPIVKST